MIWEEPNFYILFFMAFFGALLGLVFGPHFEFRFYDPRRGSEWKRLARDVWKILRSEKI